jgi:hypothetical protein
VVRVSGPSQWSESVWFESVVRGSGPSQWSESLWSESVVRVTVVRVSGPSHCGSSQWSESLWFESVVRVTVVRVSGPSFRVLSESRRHIRQPRVGGAEGRPAASASEDGDSSGSGGWRGSGRYCGRAVAVCNEQ